MRNSPKNGLGDLSGTLMDALQQGMQQGVQRNVGAQGSGLLGALGSLAGLGGLAGQAGQGGQADMRNMPNQCGLGGLEALLNPQGARRRSSASAMPASGLGGLLGALFGGGAQRRTGNNAMMASGLMAAGALGLQFLQKWMRQSQPAQQPPQQSPQYQPSQGQYQSPQGQYQSPQGQYQSPQGQYQSPQGQYGTTYGTPQQVAAPQQPAVAPGYDQRLAQAGWGQPATPTATPQWDTPAATGAAATAAAAAPAAPVQPDPAVMLLLEAMVNAAKADGHMDADERQNIHNALAAFLPATDIDARIAPLLHGPADPKALAARVQDIEQAKDVYRISCAAIVVDAYMERAYLDALGDAMFLPPDVRAQLEAEARALQDSIQSV